MSVLFPAALVLALLAIGIAMLHGSRHTRIVVPGLLIWEGLRADGVRASPRWRLPPVSLPLVLQILALLALVLALARPIVGDNREVDHWVLILDNSAPISLDDADGARMDTLRALVAQFASTAGADALVSVISTNERATPLIARQPLTPGTLDEAMERVPAGQSAADITGTIALVDAVVQSEDVTRVMVLTAAPDLGDWALLSTAYATEIVAVGQMVGNAALWAELVAAPADAGAWHLTGTARSFGMAMPERAVVTLGGPAGRRTIAEIALVADAEGVARFHETLRLEAGGLVTVSLPDDAGSFDNTARFNVHDTPEQVQVLDRGAAGQPLIAALAAVEGVSIVRGDADTETTGFDIIVVDTEDAAPIPGALVIAIAPAEESAGAMRPVFWDSAHALTAGLDWSILAADNSRGLSAGADGSVLVAAREGALITLDETPGAPVLRLGFDPRHANWRDQIGLPLFAERIVALARPQGNLALAPVCAVAAPCPLGPRWVGGVARPVDGDDAIALTGDTVFAAAGLYRLETANETGWLTVNPAPDTVFATQAVSGESLPALPSELTRWLLVAALLLLLADLALALHRRERGGWLVARGLALLVAVMALVNPQLPSPFGRDAALFVTADGRVDALEDVEPAAPAYADPAAALRLAAAMSPGRIVLDGRAWSPEIGEVAAELAARHIPLDILARIAAPGDVSVESLEVTLPVYAGDRFLLHALLVADSAGEADLVLTRDDVVMQSLTVVLEAGLNRIDLPVSELEGGAALYALTAGRADDPVAENNRRALLVEVADRARIAVIAEDEEPRAEFARMLNAQGFEALALTPGRLPVRMDVYDNYDGVVLLDTRAIALEIRQLALLEQAVREHGLGLFILGGPQSFGPGGYLETPLETLSPLSSRLPHDAPEVAMTFVLDASGSMSQTVGDVTRLDLAKQAVASAADLLDPETSAIGVVMFHSDAEVVLPLQPVPGEAQIAAALTRVQPGGGTAIYPGLLAAYEQLLTSDAAARHVVVMTDGMSDPADFPHLLALLREAGVTVSAVAIGSTAETNIAEDIALLGGGRFHATRDFEALPSILSQEALVLSAGELIETGIFPLIATGERPAFLEGIPDVMPPVGGFVQTSAKPGADVIWMAEAAVDEPRPVMAHWRYGTGNVLALTTAATGAWTEEWQRSDDYPRLFAQALRAFLPAIADDEPGISVTRIGDAVALAISSMPDDAPLLLIAPDGSETRLSPRRTGPDRLTARFVPDMAGPHVLAIGDGEERIERHIAVHPPQALSLLDRTRQLAGFAGTTGGTVHAELADIPPSPWGKAHYLPWWIALTLLLFMLDLFRRYRRFGS